MGCIKPHTSKQPETVLERRATRASAAEEVCLMTCELEMIHQMDHRPVDIPEQFYLYQNLLRRGWLWKMPAKYQAPARILMECDGVLDSDFKENGMKPKVRIVMNYGLVTQITSEGSKIAVEIIGEDTGLEEHFTSNSRGGPDILYLPEPPLEGTETKQ